jgi:hypothetical protein
VIGRRKEMRREGSDSVWLDLHLMMEMLTDRKVKFQAIEGEGDEPKPILYIRQFGCLISRNRM